VQSPADHDADNEDRGEYANDGPIDEQVRVEHGAHLRIARQGNARACLMFRSFFEHRGNQFSTREVSFYEFVKAAWPHFDPAEFSDNWHLKDICDHMQAASFARNGGSSGRLHPRPSSQHELGPHLQKMKLLQNEPQMVSSEYILA